MGSSGIGTPVTTAAVIIGGIWTYTKFIKQRSDKTRARLKVSAENYFDLAGTFNLMDRVSLRAGINNLFDNDPPRITGGNANVDGTNLCPNGPCNGNTYPGTWDALGRLLWVGATIDFLPPKPAPAPVEQAPPPPPPPPPPPATQTCPDGSVILATEACPAPPPPPPPPPPAPERG